MTQVLVAGADGIRTIEPDGSDGPVHLAGRPVTTVVRDGDDLWAIVDGREVWTAPHGGSWARVTELAGHTARCMAFTDSMLVGTSEARLYRVAGGSLEPVEAFDRAEGRDGWYTPWGGPPDTRSISEWGEDVYVNVHVGGILLGTEDGAGTWSPTIDVDADVHQVATAEGLVLAACAGGLASSTDRGASWTWRQGGLEAPYSRAVAVCGDSVLLSASNGPGGARSAVYRGDLRGDGGFQRCRGGLPEAFDDNIDTHCLDALPDGQFAAFGTSDGRVFASEDAGATWGELASGLPSVRRVLILP